MFSLSRKGKDSSPWNRSKKGKSRERTGKVRKSVPKMIEKEEERRKREERAKTEPISRESRDSCVPVKGKETEGKGRGRAWA